MKNIIIILLITTLCATSYAQTWIDNEAVWHYDWGGIATGGFIRIEYTDDTIINGKICEKLMPILYEFGLTGPNDTIISLLDTDTLNSEYTYVNGDTVFSYLNGGFHTLYNFGAQPGDTWSLGIDTNNFLCSSSIVQVDSIGTVNINSQDYRWISVSTLQNSSIGLSGKIIERFGAMEGYLFPSPRNCDSTIIVDFYSYNFTCFEDNSFPLYNVTQNDCEYLLYVRIEEKEYQNFKVNIYPNPTKDVLNISCKDGATIEEVIIYNQTGQKVFESNLNNNTIDISGLRQGLYIVEVVSRKWRIRRKLVVK